MPTWGERLFDSGTYQRVAFAPWLYSFMWGAALRLTISETYPPIPWIGSAYTGTVWTVSVLLLPLLAVTAWWLIDHSRWTRATLFGIWIRLAADTGMFAVLLTYHLSVVTNVLTPPTESRVFSRYIVGACLAFTVMLIARDVWVIHRTERLAGRIRDDE